MFTRNWTNEAAEQIPAEILAGIRLLSEVIEETFKTSGEKTMVQENPVLTELLLHSLEKAKLLNIFENPCMQALAFSSTTVSASDACADNPMGVATADTLAEGQDSGDGR